MSTKEQKQQEQTSTISTTEVPNEQNEQNEDYEQDYEEYEDDEQYEVNEQDEDDEQYEVNEQDEDDEQYEVNEQDEDDEQYEVNEQDEDDEQHEDDEQYDDNEQYEVDEQHEQHEQHEVDEQNVDSEQDEDNEKQQIVQSDDNEVQNVQEEEAHPDLYQTVASSSTAESSNHTLRDDNVDHPPVIPRPNKQTTGKISDRYTFSFSADLISQFDKYRAHMRESIQQELVEPKKVIEEPENTEEVFSVHQVHHEPAGSNSQNSREPSIKDRSTNNTPKSIQTRSSSKKNRLKKYFGISYLREKLSKHHNPNRSVQTTTTTTTTTTTLSDLATLSSDIDQHHQPPTDSEITDNERKSKGSKAKKYILKIGNLFSRK